MPKWGRRHCLLRLPRFRVLVAVLHQLLSLPDNNNNCTGNFKGSRGIATFVVIFPSRFQWRERKHGCDDWSFIWSFEFNSLSGILELRNSLLYLPVFRYAWCALDFFNLHLIWWSFCCLYSSRHVLRKLACSGWGLLRWRDRICVLHVSKPQQSFCGGSWLCSSPL